MSGLTRVTCHLGDVVITGLHVPRGRRNGRSLPGRVGIGGATRLLPTGRRGKVSRRRSASIVKTRARAAERDLVAVLQRPLSLHTLAIDVSAVQTAEITQ